MPAPWTRRRTIVTGVAGVSSLLLGCGSSDGSANESGGDAARPSGADDPGGADDRIGRVLIVGAGPAGLTAAYLLAREGVDVEVFEATAVHGGRTRTDDTFADFPIPLGAEWVHVDAAVLDEIVDDPDVDVDIRLVPYGDDAVLGCNDDGSLELSPLGDVDDDLKFAGSGWLDFFDTHVVPTIRERIRYSTPIVTVDHRGDGVVLTDAGGVEHAGDRVIVTVPLALLRRRAVEFRPPLADDRLEAIDAATVWSGFKAFFEFDEAFYPAALAGPGAYTDEGQRLFYDAAYGQTTDLHVLGLFSVGDWAEYYQGLDERAFLDDVLGELDEIFDGAASTGYVRHITQDWNAEPFARGAYLEDEAPSWISRRLAAPVGERLFFAGDAYTTFDDWGSVHTATRSAADAVARLLR